MTDRKVFQDSVTPLPDQPGITTQGMMVNAALAEHRDEKMSILFSLSLSPEAMAKLEAKVASGEIVSDEEMKRDFSPSEDDRNKLVKWLERENFEIEPSSPDGTSVYAKATAAQIEKSLKVKMVRVTRDGITYTASQNAPSLPANVGNAVHAIIGLQPFRHVQKHFRQCIPAIDDRATTDKKGTTKHGANKQSSAAPSPSTANSPPPYLVSEILKAYNADGLSVTGAGQTIAILIDTFPNDSDLIAFWRRNGVSTKMTQIAKINVGGGSMPSPEGEETLDVSWSSGVAPGAKIRIYGTGTLQFVALDKALDRIIADVRTQPGMRQLSISLGLGETYMGGPNGEVRTQHMKYLTLAGKGVNVFVSSGDAGSNPDATGHSSTGPTQAEYASSDSSVIGVGGTSLNLKSNGTVASESGWVSGGGGKSIFFPRPAWQVGSGVPIGHERLVPDVSLVADPNTGAFLILNGKAIQIGGTSWSAPVWAGFCALINEARAKANKPFLPFLNPLIYPLLGKPAFRDIKSGSNGAYSAHAGYDMVTGIGVPNVKELIKALT